MGVSSVNLTARLQQRVRPQWQQRWKSYAALPCILTEGAAWEWQISKCVQGKGFSIINS